MIEPLRLPVSERDLQALAALLVDAVDSGAAVSFVAPLSIGDAQSWWQRTLSTLHPRAVVLVARADGEIVGTVQMHPAWAPNQPFRGDIAKLMVHRAHRRQGYGPQLMRAIEAAALQSGLTLLTLDAKAGGPAEALYRHLGWIYVGTIPRFALDPDRSALHDDVIFYKHLANAATAATLDFYFFIGSTYTYLSVVRAAELARREGVTLRWRPFSVRTLMREQNNTPFAGKPVKMSYMWRDIERRASRFGVPYAGAAPYPIDAQETANLVATLAASEGWCAEFTQAAYRRWFENKQDPGSTTVLHELLLELGRDPDACLAAAGQPDVRAQYLESTATARDLGIFGSPTFVCGREIFWGDDRLEDALAWCKRPTSANGH